jgi:hypothetical protein
MRGSRTLLGALAAVGMIAGVPLPPVRPEDLGPEPDRCGGVVRRRRRRRRERISHLRVETRASRSTPG